MSNELNITLDFIIKHFEILIQSCEKLPLQMEAHVRRNQFYSDFVSKLQKDYELVKKPEVENAEDKAE